MAPRTGSGHTWDGLPSPREKCWNLSQGQDPTWPICVLPVHSSRLNCHAPAPPPPPQPPLTSQTPYLVLTSQGQER